MWRIVCVGLTAGLVLLISGCGSDDGSPDPDGDDDGNGNGTVTLLDGTAESSWAAWEWGSAAVCWNGTGLGVQAASSQPPLCYQNGMTCKARSQTIDFTPYSSARLQCTVRLLADGDEAIARVRIQAFSGIPGTPGFSVYSHEERYVQGTPQVYEEALDFSLANALGFSEGWITVEYYALSAEDGDCGSESFVEVNNLRIVAE